MCGKENRRHALVQSAIEPDALGYLYYRICMGGVLRDRPHILRAFLFLFFQNFCSSRTMYIHDDLNTCKIYMNSRRIVCKWQK